MTARIPLRLVPRAKLEATWRSGRPMYPDAYERREPQALRLEKPAEEMTLDELIATQRMEPLSESRRMFLHLGTGAMSLDAPAKAGSPTPLLEYVADTGPKCLFDAVDLELADDEAEDLTADDKYFTPYVLTDIITRRQIEWEKIQAQASAAARIGFTANEAGGLAVKPLSRIYGDAKAITVSAVRSMFAAVGRCETLDELHARVDLIRDALEDPVSRLYRDPDPVEERERAERQDRSEHNSFEFVPPRDDDDWADLSLPIICHRSPRRSEWELWHNTAPRDSSAPLELRFDLCSDAELEELLGVTEWDADGNPLIAEIAS